MTFLVGVLLAVVLALIVAHPRGPLARIPRTPPTSAERAPEPKSPTAAPYTRDASWSAHEAGHCLVAWDCSYVGRVDTSVIHDQGGRVTFLIIDDGTREAAWSQLVIDLAGIAGQMAVYGRSRSGEAETDMLKARDQARMLVKRGWTEPPWKEEPDTGKVPPFERLYTDAAHAEEMLVLRRGYRAARRVLREREVAHWRLMAAMLSMRSMTEKDIERILGPRPFQGMARRFFGRSFMAIG